MVAAILIGAWLGFGNRHPNLALLPDNHPIPTNDLPWPDRWIPESPGWSWAWRLRHAVLPDKEPLWARIEVFSGTAKSTIDVPIQGAVSVSTFDRHLHLVDARELALLRDRLRSQSDLRKLAHVGMSFADGRTHSGQIGDGSDRVTLTVLGKARDDKVDLVCHVSVASPASQPPANSAALGIDLGFQTLIPPGGGAILIDRSKTSVTAVVVSAEIGKME